MSRLIILLTACIKTSNMPFTKLTDPDERIKQYVAALRFYLNHTLLPIVFVENSNTDISDMFDNEVKNKRLEMFSFSGNRNLERGKGYGESEIIEYAIKNSKFICEGSTIIKITGRLIVYNLSNLIIMHRFFFLRKSIQTTINSDLSFADSRIIIAPLKFYRILISNKMEINDSENIFFENILTKTIKEQVYFDYIPFFIEPQIIGQSGSTGEAYIIKRRTFKQKITYFKYSISLYVDFGENQTYRRNTFGRITLKLFKYMYKYL